jgi:acyl dehydratase
MSEPVVAQGLEGLEALVGRELGPSEPLEIGQEAVESFADVTGDRQWIHVDVERAKAESPYGGPIVHGYFVLSLVPVLLFGKLLRVEGVGAMINYGADKLRFPDVTPSGAKISLSAKLLELTPKGPGKLGRFACAFQVEGASKPCCVAEILILFA